MKKDLVNSHKDFVKNLYNVNLFKKGKKYIYYIYIMFPKFDNIPNKDNIHKPQNKIALNNFRNIQSNNLEGMSNIGNVFPAETKFVANMKKEDIILNETITSAGTKAFNVLSSIAGQDDIEDNGLETVDIKKVKKLDTLSTIFVGSISVIGLYVVYKAIKKTI